MKMAETVLQVLLDDFPDQKRGYTRKEKRKVMRWEAISRALAHTPAETVHEQMMIIVFTITHAD